MQSIDRQQLEIVLKNNALSVTRARIAVFTILASATAPITIQDIINKLPNAHFVSVYRTIETFLKIGIVKQVPVGFKYHYELSDVFKPHHHHVTCERCGASVSVHSEKAEELMKLITIQAGMNPTKHYFEAYGICKSCKS